MEDEVTRLFFFGLSCWVLMLCTLSWVYGYSPVDLIAKQVSQAIGVGLKIAEAVR